MVITISALVTWNFNIYGFDRDREITMLPYCGMRPDTDTVIY